MIDAKAFGLELAGIVKAQLAPILSRMDALEKRFNELPPPKDGKDADLGEVRQIIAGEVTGLRSLLEALPQPATLPTLPDIPAMIAEGIETAVAALPTPQDGKSVTVEDVTPLIASEVERRVSELPRPKDGEPGKDGESVDPAEVQRMVSEAVDKAVSAIPVPKDGADGKDGHDGKDGVGLAGAIIDRGGELVVTLTNGETRNLGPVVGKDGGPGKDGRDGFGFEDIDLLDADEGVILRFMRAGDVKDFRLPIIVDRGVYKEGQTYRPGDGVTWGGSYWICQEETTDKPDGGKGFRLAVKKGRDGRDGVMKEAKPHEPVRVGARAKAVQ
jgi:hypothetical protein